MARIERGDRASPFLRKSNRSLPCLSAVVRTWTWPPSARITGWLPLPFVKSSARAIPTWKSARAAEFGASTTYEAFVTGESGYAALLEKSYPFHPEFVRLFAERLADIPDFHQTRGALRLVARTIRAGVVPVLKC